MAIKSRDVTVVQVPNKDNHFHAVCSIMVTSTAGQSVCALGEAIGGDDSDATGILHLAEENGYKNALAILEGIAATGNGGSICFPECLGNAPADQPVAYIPANNAASRGGGDNPMSSGQRKFILELCNGNTGEAEELVTERYGKSLDTLVGWQAHDLIGELKSKKHRRYNMTL
jgi:hypothetical protein